MTATVAHRVSAPRVVAALIGMLMIIAILFALMFPPAAWAGVDSPIRVSREDCPLSNFA